MELQEYLDEEQPVETGFVVDTEEKADWTLRKIRQFKEKANANAKLAQAEIGRIEEWLGKENNVLADSIKYFEAILRQYAEKQKQLDPKFKSMKLPNGKLRYKKQPPEFQKDDDGLVSFLKGSDLQKDYIETKETPKWGEFKKVATVEKRVFVRCEGEEIESLTKLNPAEYKAIKSGGLCNITTGETFDDLFIKDVLIYNGSVVDGVTVIERPDKFEVDVEG